MSFPAATPPAVPSRAAAESAPSARLARPRKALLSAVALVLAVILAAFFTDTALATRGEERLSHALQSSPRLMFAPEVTLGGFPFVTHANRAEFTGLTITARGVPMSATSSDSCAATHCWAELGVTSTGMTTTGDAWSLAPDDVLSFDSVTGYAKVDSVNLGRLLDIVDLSVNTPAPEDRAGGGGPADGLLERTTGVLLTGTVALPPTAGRSTLPPSASRYSGDTVRVSVSADLSVRGNALIVTATGFYDGPEEHADGRVDDRYRTSVLARFSGSVALPELPWGITPTSAHSAGSDVLITGTAADMTARVKDF